MKLKIHGFTLVELLVVIVVIGILTTIGIVSYSKVQANSRDSQRSAKVQVIAEALEKYYDHNGEYPGCTLLIKSSDVVVANTLVGMDPTALTAPSATAGHNSLICASSSTVHSLVTGSNVIAYVSDGSQTCLSGTVNPSCLSYTLTYREESTGNLISLPSRRSAQLATSGAPTLDSTSANGFSQIPLNWSDVSNAASYNIQQANDAGFSVNTDTTNVASTSATITGLDDGSTYFFRVQAVGTTGSMTDWSNIVSAKTWNMTKPVVTVGAINNNSIAVSWPAITHANGYVAQISTDSNSWTGATQTSVSGTSYTFTGLSVGTKYYIRIQAVNGSYTSDWSSTVNGTTIVPVPTGVTVVTNSSTVFTESWNTVSVATSYIVQCSTNNSTWGTGCQATVNAPTTAYAYGGAAQGQVYYVRVQALVGTATSAWSNSVGTITTVNTPSAPAITAVSPGAIRNSSAANWFPGTGFTAGAGNYYYAYVQVVGQYCPGGTYPVYTFSAHYSAKPSGAPQDYSQGPTTDGTWYAIRANPGYTITFYANNYCQGPNAASGYSGTSGVAVGH